MINFRLFARISAVFAFLSMCFPIFSANAFVILPSSCRGDLQTYCLEEHYRLEYIFIYGEITTEEEAFFHELDRLWPVSLPLPIIYLESPGGASSVAMNVGRILHKRHAVVATGNPITETDGYECSSACATLAAGATERHLNAVGFHLTHFILNYCKPNESLVPSDEAYEHTMLDYFDEVGADPRVKEFVKNTPFNELKELFYDNSMDFRQQTIVDIGYQSGPTQAFPTNGFQKDDLFYWLRKTKDKYDFAIAEGSAAAITSYADFLTCEARGHIPEYEKAEAVLRREIKSTEPEVVYQLAKLYESGHIVGKGYADAVELYRRGAEQGYARSENRLGWAYHDGHGVKQDYKQALEWFKKSVKQDDYEAYGSMCKVYMAAKAVHANDLTRYAWCDLAIAKLYQGELKDFAIDAMHRLAARMTDAEIEKARSAEKVYRPN